MFRKIIWQLLFSYLILILSAMGITGYFILRSLETQFVSTAESTLSSNAQVIAKLWESSFREKSISIREKRMVHLATERLAWQSQSRVRIIDDRGSVLMDTSARPDEPLEHREQIRRALRGDDLMEIIEAGENRAPMLSISYPIKILKGSTGRETVVGLVYITRSLVYVKEIMQHITKEYGVGILFSLLGLGLFSLVLSAYISGPVTEMTRAAERIADGDLSYRIPRKRGDEIGLLARRFDYMREKLRITMTELLGEKKKLSAVLSHMADGVMVFDSARRIVMVNSTAQMLLGGADLDEIVQSFDAARVPPFGELRTVVDEGLRAGDEGERVIRGFARGRVVEVAYSILKSEEGEPGGLVVILHDITEFQRLDDMKTEFVSNVSHELKTPLASIKGFAELLLDGALDDRERSEGFLTSINREVDRLTRLVKSLLDLSRMESGLIRMDVSAVDLALLAEGVAEKLSPQAKAGGVSLVTRIAGCREVHANADRVEQVLINLVGNALRYAPPSSEVLMELERKGDFALMRVIDSGPGLQPEDQKRVFDRFYRVDKARSRDHGGSGLGLAITKQIIENLGGKIGVESIPGKGCTFYFTLPLERRVPEKEGKRT